MQLNIMNIIGGISAVLALIGGIIAADGRYTKNDDLTTVKNEIINEMRTEVTKNRTVMISSMQRDADDLEFMMMEFDRKKQETPRYVIEKHKQIIRQIEELKNDDTKKSKSSK